MATSTHKDLVMLTNIGSRIVPLLLAVLLLATGLVAGSIAASTDTADAAPFCLNQLHTSSYCLQPLPTPNCLSPYVAIGEKCVARNPINPNPPTAEVIDWRCPQAPFLARVTSVSALGAGISYIEKCTYTPAANSFFSAPTFNPWSF